MHKPRALNWIHAAQRPASGEEVAAIAAFLIAAAIAIEVTRLAGNVSLIWPANAVAAALLVRGGRSMRPRAAIGLLGAGILVNAALAGDSVAIAAALSAVNVFEIWLVTWLLRGVWRDGPPVINLALAGRLLLLAGALAPAAGTLPGALVVHSFLDMPLLTSAIAWWQSSLCGAALIAPFIYLYSREGMRALFAAGNRRRNLALGLLSLLVTPLAIRFVDHSFIVVATPLVIVALSMGGMGAALFCLLCGLEIVAYWAIGMGLAEVAPPLPLLPMMLLLLLPVAAGIAVDDRRRAMRAHSASQRWTQQLIEQSPIGMCIMTLEGVWELSNAALQKMLGYTGPELHGHVNNALFVEEEFAAGKARTLQLLRGELQTYTVDRRLRCRDGRWLWTRCTTTLMRDDDGRPARFIVQILSLDEQRRVEHELAMERERLSTTLRAIADAVLVTDEATRVTYMNPAAERLLGKGIDDTNGRRLQDVYFVTTAEDGASPLDIASLCTVRAEVVRRESPALLHLADGATHYVQESASPLRDPDGRLNGVVVVLRDVRSEFEREQKLRRAAEQDQLTGLANRRAFEERVAAAVAHCETGAVATLLIIDLDQFKRVNDQAGHQAGDAMLQLVATALRRSTRGSDLIGRIGGDEFAIVLEDCAEAGARRIAEDVLKNVLATCLAWNGEQYKVGVSIGGATLGGTRFSASPATAREWIAAADSACYAAKAEGRGQVRFAGPRS